jgi:formiminotetrahydrofolate cyclodeaminase
MLVSDVGCGAVCCKAAMECAALNVYINTKTLKNRVVAAALDHKTDELLKEYCTRATAIVTAVTAQLRRK